MSMFDDEDGEPEVTRHKLIRGVLLKGIMERAMGMLSLNNTPRLLQSCGWWTESMDVVSSRH